MVRNNLVASKFEKAESVSYLKEATIMTTLNNIKNQELLDKYLEYVTKCEAGTWELTIETVNEIDLLLESEDIIYKEMKNLLIKFDCSDDEAMYYTSERMVDGNQMLRVARINYYLKNIGNFNKERW